MNWFNETDTTYRTELREPNDLNFARFDAKLEQRFAEVKAELRTEFRERIAELRADLLSAVAAQRADLIKWMFAFWIGRAAFTVGLVLLAAGRR